MAEAIITVKTELNGLLIALHGPKKGEYVTLSGTKSGVKRELSNGFYDLSIAGSGLKKKEKISVLIKVGNSEFKKSRNSNDKGKINTLIPFIIRNEGVS